MDWRKKEELVRNIHTLTDICEKAEREFSTAFSLHLEGIHDGRFGFGIDSLRKYKTEANNCADAVQTSLFTDSIPSVQDELVVMVHSVHRIVEELAHLLFEIRSHHISSSGELTQLLRNLHKPVSACISKSIALTRRILNSKGIAREISASAEDLAQEESLCSKAEDAAVSCLFSGGFSDEDKLEQSLIIKRLGKIADTCKHLAYHVEIAALAETE